MKKNKIKHTKVSTRICAFFKFAVVSTIITVPKVLAADDPLTVVNNLSDFIFSLIRAVGVIILGFGIVQIGLALKSHDPSQRANGVLSLAGGIIIVFAKPILDLILK